MIGPRDEAGVSVFGYYGLDQLVLLGNIRHSWRDEIATMFLDRLEASSPPSSVEPCARVN